MMDWAGHLLGSIHVWANSPPLGRLPPDRRGMDEGRARMVRSVRGLTQPALVITCIELGPTKRLRKRWRMHATCIGLDDGTAEVATIVGTWTSLGKPVDRHLCSQPVMRQKCLPLSNERDEATGGLSRNVDLCLTARNVTWEA